MASKVLVERQKTMEDYIETTNNCGGAIEPDATILRVEKRPICYRFKQLPGHAKFITNICKPIFRHPDERQKGKLFHYSQAAEHGFAICKSAQGKVAG
jgi:hypothetical protein